MPPRRIGITKTKTGWRAVVRVRGILYTKRFKSDTSQTTMQNWRAAARVDALRRDAQRARKRLPTDSFAEDVETYLKAIKAMPTYRMREADLNAWVAALGTDDRGKPRSRSEITSDEIRAVLHGWRLGGRLVRRHVHDWRTRKPITVVIGLAPLSESACNHRRTALMHLWHVLDGKSAPNPVRDAPRFREPDPEPRGIPLETVSAILDAMPDSATKARCLVMAWTGLPHATLMQLTAANVRWDDNAVYVPRRRKGKGTKARVVPLLPQAIEAFRMMERFSAWGPFSRDSLRRSLHRACDALGLPKIRPYDLRHSFATAAYEVSGDIRAVQELLDHADAKLTNRYALGAVNLRVTAALDKLRKHTTKVTSDDLSKDSQA
jgi:integrase